MFSEELLQFAWKFRVFTQESIKLSTGECLKIISPGRHNKDSGPDFEDARIQIDSTYWAGNIEIHIRSSDWYRHHHQEDPAYDNVILHVVYVHDKEVTDKYGREILTLQLKDYMPESLRENWITLIGANKPVACVDFGLPEGMIFNGWLDRLLLDRIGEKTQRIRELLILYRNNWEEVFYIMLARSFGFHANALPMELLARSVPLAIIMKHHHSRFQLEALFFGQAGFLSGSMKDEYPSKLWSEYCFLSRKYNLNKPVNTYLWKFLRMRPANFPTIRIAQFSALMEHIRFLVAEIISEKNYHYLKIIEKLNVSSYWETHYIFDKISEKKQRKSGIFSIIHVLINGVLPFLFEFGKSTGDTSLMEGVTDAYRNIPSERNHLTKPWERVGFIPENSADSQALIHLRKNFCDQRKCFECGIGVKLLKEKS